MSEFLLLHDNNHDGKPAVIRKGIITSVVESDDYQKDVLFIVEIQMESILYLKLLKQQKKFSRC